MSPGSGSPAGAGISFGVDIGGTKVLGVALGPSDEIVAEARVPTPNEGGTEGAGAGSTLPGTGVAQAIAQVVLQLDRSLGLERAPAAAAPPVGVGAPGMLDRHGRLRFSPNLPQAQGLDWYALMAEWLGTRPVVIENDANFAVLAEHRLGAARGYRHVVMVTLGTGIGGGLVVDGHVEVGGHGFAGEIGHMVVDPAGPPCPCGRRGCWERYASGGGLGLLAREAALAGKLPGVVACSGGDPEGVRGEDVTAAALAGDPDARQVVEQVGWWVGFGLANLSCVLDPQCFVLGGGLVEAGDLLLMAARRAYGALVEGGATRPETAIVAARFGERAGAVGAALAAAHAGCGLIRTGIVLPTFRDTPADAMAVARRALAAGVDGVFCYDHLWPIGQPSRPALAPFPILGALATIHAPCAGGGPFFGTLVARVGLVPDRILLGQFTALAALAPGRVIAGLGTGDHLSEAENLAYGVPFASAAERRAEMVELALVLRRRGLAVWLAGGAAARITESRLAGAALNVWDAEPALVASRTQGSEAVEVTWGGPPAPDASSLSAIVTALAGAGATWAIFGWPVDPDALVEAARRAGVVQRT